MGGLCSCFHVQDNTDSNACLCPRCFFQKFVNKHRNRLSRAKTAAIASPNQQASSSNSESVSSNSSDTRGPLNAEKHSSSVQAERVDVQAVNTKSMQINKNIDSNSEVEQRSESSAKILSSGVDECAAHEKDECPTCLEGYTEQNPMIIAKCSHHYHLSCIYEWMERSEYCPVCGKLMEFNESS